MKSLIPIALAVVLAITFASCGTNQHSAHPQEPVICINDSLQQIVEEAVTARLAINQAEWGCAVLIEKSGKVVAMFETDSIPHINEYIEVGTILTPFAVLAAASTGQVDSTSKFVVAKSGYPIGEVTIHDNHPCDATYRIRETIAISSDIAAHPQVPYPPYTLWENIRDYAWGGMLDFVLTTVIWICGVIFGVPAYLISLFFDYIDKGHWNVYLWCAYGALCLYALYKGIERYIEQKNIAIRDHRGGYHDEERLQKIIANKGYTRKAEEIMRAAYRQARAIKNDSTVTYLSSIFERAYQDALEQVMCYFDEDTRWWYLEIYDGEGGRSECLLSYSCLYEKFYGNEAFNPKKYQADIFGHFDFDIPVW